MKIDVTKILPKLVTEYPHIRTSFQAQLKLNKVEKGKIKITYINPRGGQPKPLILNRYISVTPEFLIGLGIYFGDGGKSELEITNSDTKVIIQSLEFLKVLGFDVRELNYQLTLHEIYKNLITEAEAINFWKNNKIPHINSVYWHKKGSNKVLENHNNPPKKYGYLAVRYYSRLGGLAIYFLMKSMIPRLKSKNHIISFLQGAFASEGSVLLQKDRKLMSVRYTTTSDEKEIIKNFLEKISVSSKDYGSDLGIVGKENFLKIRNFNILKIKENNLAKFEDGLRLLLEPKSTPGTSPAKTAG